MKTRELDQCIMAEPGKDGECIYRVKETGKCKAVYEKEPCFLDVEAEENSEK